MNLKKEFLVAITSVTLDLQFECALVFAFGCLLSSFAGHISNDRFPYIALTIFIRVSSLWQDIFTALPSQAVVVQT